ncbi:MAG: hypothetical protein P8J45_09370 [Phycisphaerales bacterium]|nr:hypothetical protein [Phycisphaerales bacterium]
MPTSISSDLRIKIGGDLLLLQGRDSHLVARADSVWAFLRIRKLLPKGVENLHWQTIEKLFTGLTISCFVGDREVARICLQSSGLSVRTRWLAALACLFSRGGRDE